MRLFCILFDIGMSVIMFIIGILFYISNGKGANFYNTRSTEERNQHDEKGMCRLYGKRITLCRYTGMKQIKLKVIGDKSI